MKRIIHFFAAFLALPTGYAFAQDTAEEVEQPAAEIVSAAAELVVIEVDDMITPLLAQDEVLVPTETYCLTDTASIALQYGDETLRYSGPGCLVPVATLGFEDAGIGQSHVWDDQQAAPVRDSPSRAGPRLATGSVVVRSSGPSAKSYPRGMEFEEGDALNLLTGDAVTVLDSGDTKVLLGPGSYRAENARASRVASYAAARSARYGRVRTGAVRGPVAAPRASIFIVVRGSGGALAAYPKGKVLRGKLSICLKDGQSLTIVRKRGASRTYRGPGCNKHATDGRGDQSAAATNG